MSKKDLLNTIREIEYLSTALSKKAEWLSELADTVIESIGEDDNTVRVAVDDALYDYCERKENWGFIELEEQEYELLGRLSEL